MSYLRYQRYHGILRFRYLPYRLDQVFSDVIPAIPAIPRYFGIYHTSSIRYFQMRYPRYPRVPWYGIPRVFTGVTPVNTQHDALPTEDKRPEVIRAGDVPFFKMYQTSRRFFTPVNTQHDALNKVPRAVGGCVTIASNIYDHRLW